MRTGIRLSKEQLSEMRIERIKDVRNLLAYIPTETLRSYMRTLHYSKKKKREAMELVYLNTISGKISYASDSVYCLELLVPLTKEHLKTVQKNPEKRSQYSFFTAQDQTWDEDNLQVAGLREKLTPTEKQDLEIEFRMDDEYRSEQHLFRIDSSK